MLIDNATMQELNRQVEFDKQEGAAAGRRGISQDQRTDPLS
jgi:hypothetical protein